MQNVIGINSQSKDQQVKCHIQINACSSGKAQPLTNLSSFVIRIKKQRKGNYQKHHQNNIPTNLRNLIQTNRNNQSNEDQNNQKSLKAHFKEYLLLSQPHQQNLNFNSEKKVLSHKVYSQHPFLVTRNRKINHRNRNIYGSHPKLNFGGISEPLWPANVEPLCFPCIVSEEVVEQSPQAEASPHPKKKSVIRVRNSEKVRENASLGVKILQNAFLKDSLNGLATTRPRLVEVESFSFRESARLNCSCNAIPSSDVTSSDKIDGWQNDIQDTHLPSIAF